MNSKIFIAFFLVILVVATVDATRRVYERGVLTGYLLSRNNRVDAPVNSGLGGTGLSDLALLGCRFRAK